MRFKLSLVHLSVFFCWCLLVLRCFQLQVLPNKRLEGKIQGQFATHIKVSSKRGDILDRSGRVLATSVVSQSAFIDPAMLENKIKNIARISKVLGLSKSKLLKKTQDGKRFVWVKRKLSDKNFKKLSSLNIKGLGFVEEYKRLYLNDKSMSFIIGKVDIDGQGLSGLELQYNDILKGKPIKYKTLRDGKGRPLVFSNYNILKDLKGGDIYLNIDIDSQVFLTEALEEQLEKVEAKRAWALVLDTKTGGIVASAQVDKTKNKYNKNIAVSEIHEPGSVLKTFPFVKSMTQLGIKPHTEFSCGDDGFKIGRLKIRNSHKEDCKKVSLRQAFAKSLNTVSADLALQMGEKSMLSSYKDLDFNKKTQIDFPGEARPIFYNKLSGAHHLASISFGHGISLTSLQVAKAYTAIGNGGYMTNPHYLLKYQKNGRLKSYKEGAVNRVLTDKEVFLSKGFLSSVVADEGTAPKARVKNYLVGGKTGTSQKADLVNGGYSKEVLSSFVGLFPLTSPKYVSIVVFDEPQKMRSGGSVAAPVFSKLANYILTKEQVSPDNLKSDTIRNLAQMEKVKTLVKATREKLIKSGLVPDLKGFSLREALNYAKENGLKLEVKGSGKVASLDPKPGRPVPKGKSIFVSLQ